MNQDKIGKFIAKCRKSKKITQQELAEKLGVTEKSISNWENGRNMPDLSLFKPLCEELDISINELLSGENLSKDEYQEKLEENIINTISFNKENENKKERISGIVFIIIGLLITIISFIIFKSESNFGEIIPVLGAVISLIGFSKITKKIGYAKRLILCLLFFVIYVFLIFLVDYLSVVNNNQPPRFANSKEYYDNVIIYKSPLYNVIRVNVDTPNEYYIIDYEKEYDKDTIPLSPFNRNKYGISNLIDYKSRYVDDYNNDKKIISNLPLSEKGFDFNIENNGLVINYHFNMEELASFQYDLKAALLYDSLSLFSLIDELEFIKFNIKDEKYFINETYSVTRESVKNNYRYYKYLIRKERFEYFFNKYVEKQMNDAEFVKENFKEIFVDDNLKKTKKIEVIIYTEGYTEGDITTSKYYYSENVKKTITEEKVINELITIIDNSYPIPNGTFIAGVGSNKMIAFYDENDILLAKIRIERNGSHYYFSDYFVYEEDKNRFDEIINKLFNIME